MNAEQKEEGCRACPERLRVKQSRKRKKERKKERKGGGGHLQSGMKVGLIEMSSIMIILIVAFGPFRGACTVLSSQRSPFIYFIFPSKLPLSTMYSFFSLR